jgi:hypothetical protein
MTLSAPKARVSDLFPPTSEPLATVIEAMFFVRKGILEHLKYPEQAFKPLPITSHGRKKKTMLFIDYEAEIVCKTELLRRLHDEDQEKFCVLGEESLWDREGLDLERERVLKDDKISAEPETRLVFVLDMIDGTDLLERDLENWCSAAVLFSPKPEPKVLMSIVHDSRGRLYGAHYEEGTFLITPTTKTDDAGKEYTLYTRTALGGPQRVHCRDAAICFYAQKRRHFTTIPRGFYDWLQKHKTTKNDKLRLYTLAGNPMMARLANGEKVHAVFEHRGQFPHDAVPGAYIGLKQGAHLLEIDTGKRLTEEMMARSLLTPSGKGLRYVEASSKPLAVELAAALRGSSVQDNTVTSKLGPAKDKGPQVSPRGAGRR